MNVVHTVQHKQAQQCLQEMDNPLMYVYIYLDTCGSRNLASEHLLQNIKKVEDYGHDQMYMVTVNGNSPAYNRMGELHFEDGDKNPIITLCYVQN